MAPLQFWKPGTAGPGSTLDRESEAEFSLLPGAQYNANTSLSLSSQRTRLPIYKHREKLLYSVEKYGCVVVVGQTGCGKSTRKWVCVNRAEAQARNVKLTIAHRATTISPRSWMVQGEQCYCMHSTSTSGCYDRRSSSRRRSRVCAWGRSRLLYSIRRLIIAHTNKDQVPYRWHAVSRNHGGPTLEPV